MFEINVTRLARALCVAKHGSGVFDDPLAGCRGAHRRKAARLVAEYILVEPIPAPDSADLREALDHVMRNVVIGTWYDDVEPGPGSAAVSRLHDAEAAMWRLYDFLGVDPGDSYLRRPR